MAHRFAEFSEIRDAGRDDDAVRAQLRRRKTVALKSIGQVLRTAQERDLDTASLYDIADNAYPIAETLHPCADRATLAHVVDQLECISADVLDTFRAFCCETTAARPSGNISPSAKERVESDAAAAVHDRPKYNDKLTSNPSVEA